MKSKFNLIQNWIFLFIFLFYSLNSAQNDEFDSLTIERTQKILEEYCGAELRYIEQFSREDSRKKFRSDVFVGCQLSNKDETFTESDILYVISAIFPCNIIMNLAENEAEHIISYTAPNKFDTKSNKKDELQNERNFRQRKKDVINDFYLNTKFLRACYEPSNKINQTDARLIILYANILTNQSPQLNNNQNSMRLYLERRQITDNEELSVLPTFPISPNFRQLPYLNLKLPADFFYPFSCSKNSGT